MTPRIPKEISDLIKVYEPFIVMGKLKNPTIEARQAYEKVNAWFDELFED